MSDPVPRTDYRNGTPSLLLRLAAPMLVLGAGLAAWAVGAGHRSATEVDTQVLRIGARVAEHARARPGAVRRGGLRDPPALRGIHGARRREFRTRHGCQVNTNVVHGDY